MRKALVTGCNGFIGRALVTRLRELDIDVVGISSEFGDISEQTTWQRLEDVDVVFHLAARSFVPDSWDSPDDFLETNVNGTMRALEYCRGRSSRMVFVSSYLYGIPDELPLTESAPLKPNNPYALSKHLAEQVCEFYARQFDVPVSILRPFNIFGPGQNNKFLVPEIIEQIENVDRIVVKDLRPKRDYIYLDDVVNALLKAARLDNGFSVINIGSGVSYSVEEIINIIQSVKGADLPVVSEGIERPNEVMDVRADIHHAKDILDWSPSHSFKDGIAKIIELLQ